MCKMDKYLREKQIFKYILLDFTGVLIYIMEWFRIYRLKLYFLWVCVYMCECECGVRLVCSLSWREELVPKTVRMCLYVLTGPGMVAQMGKRNTEGKGEGQIQ